jgi:hypothetical protein
MAKRALKISGDPSDFLIAKTNIEGKILASEPASERSVKRKVPRSIRLRIFFFFASEKGQTEDLGGGWFRQRAYRKTAKLSPMEYGLERDPPPLPDRPNVEGDAWQEAVQLGQLQGEARAEILDMFAKHRLMWSGRLGQVQSTNHRIDLIPGQKPVHCQPYRAGHRVRAVESAEVLRILKAEEIEPATSEWASPIVLVAKPDGSTRFCVEYRKLNAITVRDSYPLPRMDECIDSLGDANIFTTLDCNSGYWQITVRPEDREKTTFTSHEGLYWFYECPLAYATRPLPSSALWISPSRG